MTDVLSFADVQANLSAVMDRVVADSSPDSERAAIGGGHR
jgi:hypothetical protein